MGKLRIGSWVTGEPRSKHLKWANTDCCGLGLSEVKCPFSVRQQLPTTVSYIEKGIDRFKLSRKHNYYYQIQGQISQFDYAYCDFVGHKWIHVERISYDEDFISNMVQKFILYKKQYRQEFSVEHMKIHPFNISIWHTSIVQQVKWTYYYYTYCYILFGPNVLIFYPPQH